MSRHATMFALACCVLAACNFDPNQATADASGDGGGSAACFGPPGSKFEICPTTVSDPFNVTDGTDFDTAADCTFKVTPPGAVELCVRAATSIRISDKLRVSGPDPLVLLATGTFTIDGNGEVDVSSTIEDGAGAGGNFTSCPASTAGTAGTGGGGGGAGGSFRNVGGAGGTGNSAAVAGGVAGAATGGPPDFLRGGCKAGAGGAGPGTPGAGGDGGGAAYLVAGGAMVLNGTINASGAGGGQGMPGKGGGGGGGSGGTIVLFAGGTLDANGARVFANGGGGGEGGDTNNDGNPGGESSAPVTVGAGGDGGNGGAGAAGGDGAFLINAAKPGGPGGDGGGGGGGGIGALRVLSNQVLTNAMTSPNPS